VSKILSGKTSPSSSESAPTSGKLFNKVVGVGDENCLKDAEDMAGDLNNITFKLNYQQWLIARYLKYEILQWHHSP
jgi:hypothetical protein